MTPTALLFLSICFVYILIIFLFRYQWNKCAEFIPGRLTGKKKISVVVAFRNEIRNLPLLLSSLYSQDLDAQMFEVILCDDDSEDGSGKLAKDYCNGRPGYRYIKNETGETGKKRALNKGIKAAVNDIIVLTDADCITPRSWLSSLLSFHETFSPSMATGLVELQSNRGLLSALQEIDFMSLTGAGAAALLMKRPVFCSGANLSYPLKALAGLKDPMKVNVVSGDDTFMMHNLKRHDPERIMLVRCRDSIITTQAATGAGEFFRQRLRWASKAVHYRDKDTLALALLVFFVNLSVLVSLFMIFLNFSSWWLFALLFGIKAFADYCFLRDVMSYFGKKLRPEIFITAEAMYPFYAVITPLVAAARGFSWKGRKY